MFFTLKITKERQDRAVEEGSWWTQFGQKIARWTSFHLFGGAQTEAFRQRHTLGFCFLLAQ